MKSFTPTVHLKEGSQSKDNCANFPLRGYSRRKITRESYRHVPLAFAGRDKEEQKRSFADTRYNEEILNKVRELQVSTLEEPSETVASCCGHVHATLGGCERRDNNNLTHRSLQIYSNQSGSTVIKSRKPVTYVHV